MALVGILIALIIMALIFFFTFIPSGPKQTINPQNIESNAQNATDQFIKNSKLEQGQVRNIDQP